MKRGFKQLTAGLMAAISIVGMSVPAQAASDYAKKTMNNSYSYTQYNCTFWGQSNFWDVWWGADGTSKTAWMGASPVNADSITHKDVLSCTGVGSMSIGANPSGANASASISGHTATYSYSVSNKWTLSVNYNYKHTGLLAAWNYSMDTKATVQLGSSFYSWGT